MPGGTGEKRTDIYVVVLKLIPPKLTPKNLSTGQFAFWPHFKDLATRATVHAHTTCGTNWHCWQFKKKGWGLSGYRSLTMPSYNGSPQELDIRTVQRRMGLCTKELNLSTLCKSNQTNKQTKKAGGELAGKRFELDTLCCCMCVCVRVCVCVLSYAQLFVTPGTVDCQAPLSMGFTKHENWSGVPFLLQGTFPTQRLNTSLASPVLASFHTKSLQLSLTLCDPRNCGPPGSSVMGFSRQEHWSGLPFPFPGDLPHPGI